MANHLNFRRAAEELEQTPSAVSHAMRALEQQLGVRLFHRTTRSVSLTQAGTSLSAELRPLLHHLSDTLDNLNSFRDAPQGLLRINGPQSGLQWLLRHVVPMMQQRYPAIELDLVANGQLIDIVEEGFDAGIRLLEFIPQDMVVVPILPKVRFITVASPTYLASMGMPTTPEELHQHHCIRNRLPSGKLYHWEFEKQGIEQRIDVPGSLTLNDMTLMIEAARAGSGIAYVLEQEVEVDIAEGKLVTVLNDWCPIIEGIYLYYPGHRQVPRALKAFIEVLRE